MKCDDLYSVVHEYSLSIFQVDNLSIFTCVCVCVCVCEYIDKYKRKNCTFMYHGSLTLSHKPVCRKDLENPILD